jgi:hypothetical protein
MDQKGDQKMDRKTAKKVRTIIEKELNKILKKHGLSVEMGNARFTDTCLTTKITIADGDGESTNKSTFETDKAYMAGFRIEGPNPAGKVFTSRCGKKYEVVRFDSKKRKYPVICKCITDGALYKFAAESVIKSLEI